MAIPAPTTDEIISILNRTSLATVLVEGNDDAQIYRHIERELGRTGTTFDIMECGGRDALLRVYCRRAEIKNLPVVFFADLDTWHFTSVPAEYSGVVFTRGYSIENDLLAGSNVEDLMDQAERRDYERVVACLCDWFAHELAIHEAGRDPIFKPHPREIVDRTAFCIEERIRIQRSYPANPPEHWRRKLADYRLALRGKTLIEAILMFLSASERASKFSRKNIIEMCSKLIRDHPYINRIVQDVFNNYHERLTSMAADAVVAQSA